MKAPEHLRTERMAYGLTLYSLAQCTPNEDAKRSLVEMSNTVFSNLDGPPLTKGHVMEMVRSIKNELNVEIPEFIMQQIRGWWN